MSGFKRNFMGSGVEKNAVTGEEYIYYNFNIVNNSSQSQACNFIDSLNAPILEKGKAYFVSCVRFVLDGSTIPIFVYKPGAYRVTLTDGINTDTQIVGYSGNDKEFGLDTVYSYTDFLEMINDAYNTAFGNITPPVGVTEAPRFVYNAQAGLISMFVQRTYEGTGMEVWMNSELYGFFNNFYSFFQGEGRLDYKDYQIITKTLGFDENVVTRGVVPVEYLQMQQEYTSLYSWFDITGIIFTSNGLGVKPEYLPTQNNSQSLTTNSSSGAGPSTTPILTDFQPYYGPEDAAGPRGYLYYTPSVYRYSNVTRDEIISLDLSIRLRARTGETFQYYVPPHQSVQVKIMFAERAAINGS